MCSAAKGIPHVLDVWEGFGHDWPWWHQMAREVLSVIERRLHDQNRAFCTEWKIRSRPRWWIASTRCGVQGVAAEHLKVGGVRMAEPCGYDVIIDRISHDIPFYRSYLKNAVLTGTKVINNPVLVERRRQVLQLRAGRETRRRGAADRAAAAQEASRRAPPTARMRNLEYPLDWDGIFRLRRLPGVPEAARWRRLEERLQGRYARGILRCLR